MKVLVIGGGGREHAIAWKLAQDPTVSQVFLAPGNPGMALDRKIECTGISASDFPAQLRVVKEKGLGFIVVGPDQALADGAVDFFDAQGVPAFGPTKEAAKIEWSKAYSKDLMREAKITTARYESFSDANAARDFLSRVEWGNGWVVKADGLALGKGVVVCENREEALRTVDEFLSGSSLGRAGLRIVVEERLLGREVSAFFLCDGTRAVPLGLACDYKRIFNGDLGPNTGGMGAFSPAEWTGPGFTSRVQEEVANPLLKVMQARKTPFRGILFVGLMVTKAGPYVLEFNARFGDPETQVLLPLLDEELLPWLAAAQMGSLSPSGPRLKKLHGVHVVMAAAGYPGAGGQEVRKGDSISVHPSLLPESRAWEEQQLKLFFAGVAGKGHSLTTNGGRVLGLTALAESREEARKKAYAAAELVRFAGSQRRADVGA